MINLLGHAEECHAELCYAESLLQQAFLTFIQDENFVSFIKGALRIKTCLNSYRLYFDIYIYIWIALVNEFISMQK